MVSSVLSSHRCSYPALQCAKRCMVEREKCRKREKRNYQILKAADPLQLLMLRERWFFSCGRAGQFSPNCWAVRWPGRNSTAITGSPVSCPITERFRGEATMFGTFNQGFLGRSFHPERDTPSYGGNNSNFPPPVSGLLSQKAPAYWYCCYGEILQSNSFSPGLVGAAASGNHLGHLPFPCCTCCYHLISSH